MFVRIVCVVTLFVVSDSASADEPRKLAFLVGVDKYQRDGLADLNFADDDAERLAAVLKGVGFEVDLLLREQATGAAVRTRFAEFVAKTKLLRKTDIVLVSMSGHGIEREVERDGKLVAEPFFCPNDALKSDTTTLISLSQIMHDLVDQSGSSQNLLVIDACREDPTRGGKGLDGGTVKELPAKLSMLFACSSGQRSFESSKVKHGVFTYLLIEGLEGKARDDQGEITWLDLAAYVQKNVPRRLHELLDDTSAVQSPNLLGNLVSVPVLAKLEAVKPPATVRPTTPTETSVLTLSRFNSLLGKASESAELIAFRNSLGNPPEVARFDNCYFHTWKANGLSFRFNDNGLTTVFLFADGADGHTQFRGELPAGLTFSDTREDVERKLGIGDPKGSIFVAYEEKGLGIGYDWPDMPTLKNKISHITIKKIQTPSTHPADSSGLSVARIRSLFGKAPESAEIAQLRTELKSDPEISKMQSTIFHKWKDRGLTLKFDSEGLAAVFLYAEGAENYKQYIGKLPENLKFSDTRNDVDRKLGPGPEPYVSQFREAGLWVNYPEKGFGIEYVSKDATDWSNRIHHIVLTHVTPPPAPTPITTPISAKPGEVTANLVTFTILSKPAAIRIVDNGRKLICEWDGNPALWQLPLDKKALHLGIEGENLHVKFEDGSTKLYKASIGLELNK